MKKAIGLFAILMIALSIVGFAYAHWSDIIKINGEVRTGVLTVGFTEIVRDWDKEDYYLNVPAAAPPGWEYKDVGTTKCTLLLPYTEPKTDKTVYKKLHMFMNNTYGCYWGLNKFTIDNAGTVPAHIANVTMTPGAGLVISAFLIDQVSGEIYGWVLDDAATGDEILNVWLYKEGPDWPVWEPPDVLQAADYYIEPLPCNQIDPCQELMCEIWVHVKQTAPQCTTFTFEIEIGFVNWN